MTKADAAQRYGGAASALRTYLTNLNRERNLEPVATAAGLAVSIEADFALQMRICLTARERQLLTLCLYHSLEKPDLIEVLDAGFDSLDTTMPMPGWEGVSTAADEWARDQPAEVLRVFFYEIFTAMPEAMQSRAAAWIAENYTQDEQRQNT